MRKASSFRLRRKITHVFRWIVRPRRIKQPGFPNRTLNPISRLLTFAKKICCLSKSSSGYIRMGQNPIETKPVPKGCLAVYVGDPNVDLHRFFVPVIYFNHPLFGDLLKEAEKVYGFDQSGGLSIPCGISEFEKVQTKIAAREVRRNRSWRCRYCR